MRRLLYRQRSGSARSFSQPDDHRHRPRNALCQLSAQQSPRDMGARHTILLEAHSPCRHHSLWLPTDISGHTQCRGGRNYYRRNSGSHHHTRRRSDRPFHENGPRHRAAHVHRKRHLRSGSSARGRIHHSDETLQDGGSCGHGGHFRHVVNVSLSDSLPFGHS